MGYDLPEWAESKLRGITAAEVFEVLGARRRWARPSLGGPIRVTLVAGRTAAGRPLMVAVREIERFTSLIIAARELTDADLAAFEIWEAETDEPFEG
ncbi:hypothetical protein [Nocardia terpenica]|uniref:Uncharacterized protein n=1 Tax=Nocardia terpenica TaxID=455432 RepID=A0A164MFP5_9NOCA|nr:hypothetical protein [Nocardia terpenica]KZM73314.1 hypothetical protein AWN90_32145 [Nocardia terpenica]NQE87536.1 hypothetical protein [Nocardia terpenica]